MILLVVAGTFTAADADVQVTLQWDRSTGDSIVGYRLFRRIENQSYDFSSPVYDGTTNQCTLDNLAEGTVYYFVVRAYDSQNNLSGNSNEVRYFFDINPPDAPDLVNPEDGALDVSLEPLMATGPFYDPDPGDYHIGTRWQIFRNDNDLCIFDQTDDTFLTDFQLPPFILEGSTTYYWTARHINENGMPSQTADNAYFTTAPWLDDGNGNGVPDSQEVDVSSVIPGSQRTDLKCFQAARGGVNVGLGAVGNGLPVNLTAAQAVDPDRLETSGTAKVSLSAGLFNYRLEVSQPSQSASLTIYLSTAVPGSQGWMFYYPSDYARAGNYIHASDRKSVTIQVQDGGEGDMDGVANGIIVGLSGYGTLTESTPTNLNGSSSGGGGGGGCFIGILTGK